MPIFFQHQINETTRLGIWKIEETEEFFLNNVPLQREVTHPHKRLQHLAGRFLLQFLFPDFPYDLIRIADTRKPYLDGERYHFSISHCGDYAAAIVSSNLRVGVDIEIPTPRIQLIAKKFLSQSEMNEVNTDQLDKLTFLWSSKEAIFKWYGKGQLTFSEHMQLNGNIAVDRGEWLQLPFSFTKNEKQQLIIHARLFNNLVLAWLATG